MLTASALIVFPQLIGLFAGLRVYRMLQIPRIYLLRLDAGLCFVLWGLDGFFTLPKQGTAALATSSKKSSLLKEERFPCQKRVLHHQRVYKNTHKFD